MGSICSKHSKHKICEKKHDNLENSDHHMICYEKREKTQKHGNNVIVSSPRRLETYIHQFFECPKCGQKFDYVNLLKLHYFVEHIEKKDQHGHII